MGEVTQKFKSGRSLKADKISESGAYPVYGGNGLRGYTSTYNHEGEFALIGRQGALCGNMNYFIGKAYFTEHAVAVEADENNNTRFKIWKPYVPREWSLFWMNVTARPLEKC